MGIGVNKPTSDFFVDLQKVGNTFTFKRKSGDEDTYVLECDGPEGLPSRLVKKTPAYGANPEETKVIVKFQYSNVNQISDDLFEIPTNLPQTNLAVNTGALIPYWATYKGS